MSQEDELAFDGAEEHQNGGGQEDNVEFLCLFLSTYHE
jgi:hypothetical protein